MKEFVAYIGTSDDILADRSYERWGEEEDNACTFVEGIGRLPGIRNWLLK